MNDIQADTILKRFREHEEQGVFFAPQIDWTNVLTHAIALSSNHTRLIESRFLDIIHVASALSWNANRFYTFYTKQSQLAETDGMRLI